MLIVLLSFTVMLINIIKTPNSADAIIAFIF